jgi:SAM-dependent methyltransferase
MRYVILWLTLATLAGAQATLDAEVWGTFLTWLKKAPPSDSPLVLMQAYAKHQAAAGVAAPEMDRQREVIMRMMRTREDGWQVMFNNIYATPGAGFNQQPNATLMKAIEGRPAGRALDAGMGQGRNTIFLALKGWQATGFDVADEGLKIARENARKAGVTIEALQQSERGFDYGSSRWDLILFSYVPFPVGDARYVERLRTALRPGGLIVIESFGSDAGAQGRRPVDVDPVQLKSAFGGFRILHLEDVMDKPDWIDQKARLVRVVAEKPQ